MKNQYITAEVRILTLKKDDVIRVSNGDDKDDNELPVKPFATNGGMGTLNKDF